jgi:hypothetical protein
MAANSQDTLKWKMTNAALAITKASVTPILKAKDGQIAQEGTGTFFQIDSHKLLVTAAHVLEVIFASDSIPIVLDSDNENEQIKPAPLLGRSDMCGNLYDIAITLLDNRTMELLPSRVCLPLSCVDVGTVLPGAFCIGGFPAILGLGVPENRLLSGCMICTTLYAGFTGIFGGCDRDLHILVDRMEEVGSTDSDGRTAALPDSLGGASGSPLLQTYKDGNPFGDWKSTDIRVVGVATGEWRQAIISTRWAVVLAFAYNRFPELRYDLDAIGVVPNRVQIPAAIYR